MHHGEARDFLDGFLISQRKQYETDPFKTLKEPAHGGALGRPLELIGHGLARLRQPLTNPMFGQSIDEQTQHHDEARRHHPLRFLDKDGRRQKSGILQHSNIPFHSRLVFVQRNQLFRAALGG
jgi:hypothetical protein